MKLFLIYLFSFISLIAQYKISDHDLIKQTASKNLELPLVLKYLYSNNSDSTQAALLSIANTKDTSFIPYILSLKMNSTDQSSNVLFTLGQLGQSKTVTNFILNKIEENGKQTFTKRDLYYTLGLVSDSLTAHKFLSYSDLPIEIIYTITNLYMRGIEIPGSRKKVETFINNGFEVFYGMYRIGPDPSSFNKLESLISDSLQMLSNLELTYLLGCFRKLKMYPDSDSGISLLSHDDWKVRVETAKAIVYSPFDNIDKIDKYLALLFDKNPNVSRTASSSLRNINFKPDKLTYIQEIISSALAENSLTDNVRGELFYTLCHFNSNDIPELIEQYEDEVNSEFIYRAIGLYNSDPAWSLSYFKENMPDAAESELLNMLQPFLALQANFVGDKEYSKILITLLQSSYPSTIAIVADGIDSLQIVNNAAILQQVVLDKCFEYKNDSNYTESIFSLANLAKRISEHLETTVLEILRTSKLYSIKTFALEKLGIDSEKLKEIPDIDLMIEAAFNFSRAIIKTTKGNFSINLIPEIAPISVGNFCLLSSKEYFNNVVFHRVVPNFVIQTGDPTGTGWGGPGYEIVSEFSPAQFERGFVGMASAGPNTEGSQWFVMHNNFPHLNGRYTVFGEVIQGMSVVDMIDQGDRIISIELERE
jgi:cyclophilin family peptidyl-prolyl cis-trans isomerase